MYSIPFLQQILRWPPHIRLKYNYMKEAKKSTPATNGNPLVSGVHYCIKRVYPASASDLAKLYKVDTRTFIRWLKKFDNIIGEKIGRYYNVKQVECIIECLGTPYEVWEKER